MKPKPLKIKSIPGHKPRHVLIRTVTIHRLSDTEYDWNLQPNGLDGHIRWEKGAREWLMDIFAGPDDASIVVVGKARPVPDWNKVMEEVM